MKRKISSGSFATDSDWTPIDADDQELLRATSPVEPNQGPDSVGNSSQVASDQDWYKTLLRQREQALAPDVAYAMPMEKAAEIARGSAFGNLGGSSLNSDHNADFQTGVDVFSGKPKPEVEKKKNAWLEFVASREAGRDGYDTILGNGKYGKPDRNITDMTVNEVLDYQRKNLLPSARSFGVDSSAVGKYQIVSKTLNGLARQMGLNGDEKFDSEMQDRMAWHLTKGNGRNTKKLRNEWQSFNSRSDKEILDAYDLGATQRPNTLRDAEEAIERQKRSGIQLPMRSDSRRGINMFKS